MPTLPQIDRIIISGYRCFEHLDLLPQPGMNIIVGDNESGKSTLLEAITLALTGKLNGRWVQEELNPVWFSRRNVATFFEKVTNGEAVPAPEILIELYLSDADSLQRLRGVHNSLGVDCPGVQLRITPSDNYSEELKAYLADTPPAILPVEFYSVEWRDFSDHTLTQRPKELAASFIDARTIRSTSGVDYHTREMLSEHLDGKERASISLAHRKARQEITDQTLAGINERIAKANESLHERPIGLQMDQSSRTSWETGIVPQVDGIPFAMSGQGQQASVKVALAMSRTAGTATFVLIEEPENHLSYTSLVRLLFRIAHLAGAEQQLFLTTHSSFVLNRLGLDRLVLLHSGQPMKLSDLPDETVAYFRKLAGYDTLRLVLARKLVLVEGPSDAIVFERAFEDSVGMSPLDAGVDVLSMNGLTFKRGLEVCACLDRNAVALQDNDGKAVDEVRQSVSHLLATDKRMLLVSDRAMGRTLEPQLIAMNSEPLLRKVLNLNAQSSLLNWMTDNKTEAALRILDSAEKLTFPNYITEAVALVR